MEHDQQTYDDTGESQTARSTNYKCQRQITVVGIRRALHRHPRNIHRNNQSIELCCPTRPGRRSAYGRLSAVHRTLDSQWSRLRKILPAEFERELISERTQAGLASVRARGYKGGRRYKMTPAKLRMAMASKGHKETKVDVLCTELGITHQAPCRHAPRTG